MHVKEDTTQQTLILSTEQLGIKVFSAQNELKLEKINMRKLQTFNELNELLQYLSLLEFLEWLLDSCSLFCSSFISSVKKVMNELY